MGQRRRGIAVWLALATIIRQFQWTLLAGLIVNAITFAICVPLLRPYMHVKKMPLIARRWYDIPAARRRWSQRWSRRWSRPRAGSAPSVSGIIALFPIVFTSLMLILHPRIGGPPTAAVVANGAWGLMGFGIAIAVHACRGV